MRWIRTEHGRLRRRRGKGVIQSYERFGLQRGGRAGRALPRRRSINSALPAADDATTCRSARLATATPTYLLYSDVAKASGGTRDLGARGQKH